MSFGDQGLKLKRVDILNLLRETDMELAPGPKTKITMAGGSAIMFWRADRAGTKDIDVIAPTPLPKDLIAAAERVAIRHGITKNWLNTDASLMPQPQLDIVPEQVFEGENRLIVFIPNPKYMLAMKLLAARPEDLSDAIALARRTGLKKYRDMIILMEESYPSEVQEHFDVNFISEVASRI